MNYTKKLDLLLISIAYRSRIHYVLATKHQYSILFQIGSVNNINYLYTFTT